MMELISVHVPKTAGLAFGKVLETVYSPEQLCKEYDVVDLRTIGPEVRALHGHFRVAKYHGMFPTARRITWLRHPVRWAISLYYYYKHIAVLPGNPLACRMEQGLTLLEFAGHPMARNTFTNIWLYGLDLDAFFFVGVQEHMHDDLRVLAHTLGWGPVAMEKENGNPEPGYAEIVRGHLNDRRLVAQIESYYDLDMALYERALKLRARRGWRVDKGGELRRTRRFFGALLPR